MAVKILLDPGHFYGVNKVTNGYAEGTRMWVLYTMLRPMLEEYGFTVGTTRTSTYTYPKTAKGEDNITGRGQMAKGYDIMLSLHTNAAGSTSVNRPVIIYPVSGKLNGLADRLGLALQKCMNLQTYQIMQKLNSAGNADYYGVIRGAASVGVPCLIIEHTFHTNPTMAKWLMSDANLKKVAQCVADTVAAYYGYVKPMIDDPQAPERTDTVPNTNEEGESEVRYNKLKEITSEHYRPTVDKLIQKGLLQGKGGEGEDLVIDLSEDTVRTLVILDRAGVFGE